MKVPFSLLKALNVRRDEWWLVQRLFLLQFFQGAGIAFFFTSAFSRFLEHFPVSGLAYVFILSSFLLWATGFFYTKLEHGLSPSRLCILITLVLAGSMVLFRVGAALVPDNWFYFLMLAWFNVLYLLNNLMFWGMASQLYDVRQSKRLFGVISAGDIPAKFIGYSVASLIVSYTGTANLLIAGAVFILLSFPFLKNVLHAGKGGHIHHAGAHKHQPAMHKIVQDYTANTLIRRVAILSLIVSACIILINYGFYAEVKQAYKKDIELARFIAFFLATARLIALVIKILFTSRLLYWLGNRSSLIITPVMLISLIIALMLSKTMSEDSKTIFYLFGLSAILVDVLRSAINSPILLTMMQPLSTLERLRAHNIVKGIMDPFAYFFSGVLLLILFKWELYSLEALSLILLALAIAWIIGVLRVDQQYLKTLIKTISSRFFSQEEFNLYDATAREMIEERIKSGSELEVLYILQMLGSRRNEQSDRLILMALQHPSPTVVTEAMKLIGMLNLLTAETPLVQIIENNSSDEIRSKAIRVLGKLNFREDFIPRLMSSDSKLIRQSAMITVMNHGKSPDQIQLAESKIKELLSSGSEEERKEAAEILCETHRGNFDAELTALLKKDDTALQLAVIKAMGHHSTPVCLEQLIRHIDRHEKAVLEALTTAGEKSLPFIRNRVLDTSCRPLQKEKLINTIGRIGGHSSFDMLIGLIHELPGFQPYLIRILHRYRFKAGKNNQKKMEMLVREYLVTAAALLHMQKALFSQKDEFAILYRSLVLELEEIRETLLNLFTFLYDREKISKVKTALGINKKETIANAIELIDMTVKKEFANPFNAAFEQGDLEHRCALLKNLFPKDIYRSIETIIEDILADKSSVYNNWTKACSLYASRDLKTRLEATLIRKYSQSEILLLKETAEYAGGIN